MTPNRTPYPANLSLDEYYERHVKPTNEWRIIPHGPYPTRAQLRRHYHHTHFFGPAYPKQRQRFLYEQARMARFEAEVWKSNLPGDRRNRIPKDIQIENDRFEEDRLAKFAKLEARRIKFAKYDDDRIAKLVEHQISKVSQGSKLVLKPLDIQQEEKAIPLSITVTMSNQQRTRHLDNFQKLHDTTAKLMEMKLDASDVEENVMSTKLQIKDYSNETISEPLVLKIGDEILYDEAYKKDTLWMQQIDINYTSQEKKAFTKI